MSKKKHILRGVGASAMAVATIVSGLSFGSAAVAADTPGVGDHVGEVGRTVQVRGQVITTSNTFYAWATPHQHL